MQVSSFKQGTPNWADLSTSDEQGALQFYSGLFGWQDDARPMDDAGFYHMQQIEGSDVGAISRQMPDDPSPPHWNVYLAVDDVDGTAARVEAAGGTVVAPPFDVFDSGRMAVITDPTGAFVSLWQAKEHPGFGRIREHGAVTWAELITTDPERAASFFRDLLGVTSNTMDMGEGQPPYTLLDNGDLDGQGVAGIAPLTPEMGAMPPSWALYFETDDTDATVARARELGATILQEPMDIMPGRFAMIRDPQGAVFGVIKSAPMEMPS